MEVDTNIALSLSCTPSHTLLVDSMSPLDENVIAGIISGGSPGEGHVNIARRIIRDRYSHHGWRDYMYCYVNSGQGAMEYMIEQICKVCLCTQTTNMERLRTFVMLLYSPIALVVSDGKRYSWRLFNTRIWVPVDSHQIRNMIEHRIHTSQILNRLDISIGKRDSTCNRLYRSIVKGDVSSDFFSSTFNDMCDNREATFCMETCLYDIRESAIRKILPGDLCTLAGDVDPDNNMYIDRRSEMMGVLSLWMGGQDVADSYMNILACALSEFSARYAVVNSGTGADGKSTFFHVVSRIFGSYCMTMPTTGPVTDSRSANEATPVANAMVHRRVGLTTDASDIGRLLSSSGFKSVSGGDTMYLRGMYKEAEVVGQRLKMLLLVATNQADFVVASIHELTRVRVVKWLSKRVSSEDRDIIPKHQITQSGDVINKYENVFVARYGACMMTDLISRHMTLMKTNMQIQLCNTIRQWTRDTVCPKTIRRFLAACTESSSIAQDVVLDDASRLALSISRDDMSASVESLYMAYMIWRRGGARFSSSDPTTMEAFRVHLEFYHRLQRRMNARGEEELYVEGLRLKHSNDILGLLQSANRMPLITNPIIYTDSNVYK